MQGRKSIVTEITILNQSNPQSPFVVRLQANKNHGICDIVVGSRIPQEIVDEKTKQKRTIMRFSPVSKVGGILSSFQGRQYDDPEVLEHLKNALHVLLNTL